MSADQLSRTFSALADPTRRAILERLSGGVATVGELAAPFDMTFAAVSKHLRVLEERVSSHAARMRSTALPVWTRDRWLRSPCG